MEKEAEKVKMLTLICLIVGEGSVFPVEILDNKVVGILKDEIRWKINKLTDCDAREMELYMAMKNGKEDGDFIANPSKEQTELLNSNIGKNAKSMYLKEELKMNEGWELNEYFKGDLAKKSIHVLVKLPTKTNKRKRTPFDETFEPAPAFQEFPQLFQVLALKSSFKDIRKSGLYYADKTQLIIELIKEGHVFLSRPRRFGKSLIISVLEHLFLGHKDLFNGLYAYDNWNWENKCPVIIFDFSCVSAVSFHNDLLELLLGNAETWNIELNIKQSTSAGIVLKQLLTKIHELFHCKVIVLIDEYDMPISKCMNALNNEMRERLMTTNHGILLDFFLNMKSMREIIHFSFVTGSSMLARTSIFSGDNARKDISFSEKYATICGFTMDDIEPYLTDENNLLTGTILEDWYDGYEFGGKSKIFNPFAIVNAFSKGCPGFYWVESGVTSTITKFCEGSEIAKCIKDIIPQGTTTQVNVKNSITVDNMLNKKIPVVELMVQAGYLAVSKNDENNFVAKIPNDEVRHGVFPVLARLCLPKLKDAEWPKHVSNAIKRGNMKKFYDLVYNRLCGMPYSYAGNMQQKEEFYKFMIYASLHDVYSGVVCTMEKTVSSGRMDLLIEAKQEKIRIIIELKVLRKSFENAINKGIKLATTALEQARDYSEGNQANIIAGWVISGKNKTLLNVSKYGDSCRPFEILSKQVEDMITNNLTAKRNNSF